MDIGSLCFPMTVRIGKITFSDWKSLHFQDGWTDTFIFRMSARVCLPPSDYARLIRRVVSPLQRLRRSASIWVQVDGRGGWYAAEVRRVLKGLRLPVAVTREEEVDWLDFSFRPWLGVAPLPPPPSVEDKPCHLSQEAMLCLQALGRMVKGNEQEIASLAGLPLSTVQRLLPQLQKDRLAIYKVGHQILRKKSRPVQMDRFPLWHLTRPGLSLALRKWGVPRNVLFPSRHERNLFQVGTKHRHIARLWPEWLKAAWPQAEIWTGWSEVGIPGFNVIPDALAWGQIWEYETLFWLEVGDEHKSRDQIREDMAKRLGQAIQLSERTGVGLVFAHLGPHWVHEAARWACVKLPIHFAVAMGDWRHYGKLPIIEWGKLTGL
jgi:hypothetical protein